MTDITTSATDTTAIDAAHKTAATIVSCFWTVPEDKLAADADKEFMYLLALVQVCRAAKRDTEPLESEWAENWKTYSAAGGKQEFRELSGQSLDEE
jgi:hypothetical protein